MADSDGSMADGPCQVSQGQHAERLTSGSGSEACENGQDERSGAAQCTDKDPFRMQAQQASGANSRPSLQGFVKKGGRPVTWVGGGGMDAKRLVSLGVPQLRALFLEVFGEHTASNNASWLRRKLSEAPDETYGQGRCPTVRARDSCAAIWTSGTTQGEAIAGPTGPEPEQTHDGSLASTQTTGPSQRRASSRNTDHIVPRNDWEQAKPPSSQSADGASKQPMQVFGGRGGRRSLKRTVSCSGYTDSVPLASTVADARVKTEQGNRCQRTVITWEEFGDQYVNHEVEVYWPADKTWWSATITQLDVAARSMHLVYSNLQEEDVSGSDLVDMLQSGQLSEGWHPRNRPARRPSSRRLLTLRVPSETASGSAASPSTIGSSASAASRASRLTARAATFSTRSNRSSSFSTGAMREVGEQLVEVKEEQDADPEAKKTCIRASELQPGMLTRALAVGREDVTLCVVASPSHIAARQPQHGIAGRVPPPPWVYRTHSLPHCSSTGDGAAMWLAQPQQQQEEHHVQDGLVLPDLPRLAASFAVQPNWLQASHDASARASADCLLAVGAAAGLQLLGSCHHAAFGIAAPLPLLGAHTAPSMQHLSSERDGSVSEAMEVDLDASDWLSNHELGPSSDDGTSGASLSEMQTLDDGNGCYAEIDNLLSRPLSALAVVGGMDVMGGGGMDVTGHGSNGSSCRSFVDLGAPAAATCGGADPLAWHMGGLFNM